MFKWIYDRSFQRNKKMLNDLGLHYTKKQHKLYEHKLAAQELKPMSVKGVIVKNKLNYPVVAKDASAYSRDLSRPDGGGWVNASAASIEACRMSTERKIRDVTDKKSALVKKYVAVLSDVMKETFDVSFTENVNDVLVEQDTISSERRAFEGRQYCNLLLSNKRSAVIVQ